MNLRNFQKKMFFVFAILGLRFHFGYLPSTLIRHSLVKTDQIWSMRQSPAYELVVLDSHDDLMHMFKVERHSACLYDSVWDCGTGDVEEEMYKSSVYRELRDWFQHKAQQTLQCSFDDEDDDSIESIYWAFSDM